MTAQFQILHYVPNLFLGGGIPVAAVVRVSDKGPTVVVRASGIPDERCLGGHEHSTMLEIAFERLERDLGAAVQDDALGPHFRFDEPRWVPAGVSAEEWLRERILPKQVLSPTAEETSQPRHEKRSTHGFRWLTKWGLDRFVRKRFRPEKVPEERFPMLHGRGLRPVTHWAFNDDRLLLMEPVVLGNITKDVIENIATLFGAYRYHLANTRDVTLTAYLLNGRPSDSIHRWARESLSVAAHWLVDTSNDSEAAEFVGKIRMVGQGSTLLQ